VATNQNERDSKNRDRGMSQCSKCMYWKGPTKFRYGSDLCKLCMGEQLGVMRVCLGCERPFHSKNALRICGNCKEQPDWKDDNVVY
jgi:predicted amidophosphoribosyltransferase